jgi:hypothetical protein
MNRQASSLVTQWRSELTAIREAGHPDTLGIARAIALPMGQAVQAGLWFGTLKLTTELSHLPAPDHGLGRHPLQDGLELALARWEALVRDARLRSSESEVA